MLNKRQERIISIFYENKEWITGKELARLMSVSDRTIRSDIDAINKHFKEELILSNIRTGYFLDLDKYNQIYVDAQVDIPQTPAQRCTYLIQQLLIHEDGVNLTFLQEDIFVSGYSIENDIKKVRKTLERYPHLKLVRSKNYIYLKGDEIEKRKLYKELLSNETQGNFLNLNKLAMFYKDFDLINATDILVDVLKENQYIIKDTMFPMLILHIGISIERMLNCRFYTTERKNEKLLKSIEYKIAKEYFERLKQDIPIEIHEDETCLLALLFSNKSGQYQPDYLEIEETHIDMDQLLEEVVTPIEKKLHVQFHEDDDFMAGLKMHLQGLIDRYKHHVNADNLFIHDIKRNYPLVFEMGVSVGKALEERLNIQINESEMGFIALHFGAAYERLNRNSKFKAVMIIPYDQNFSSLGQKKIESTFGERLEIVETLSLFEEAKVLALNPDLLITTTPLSHELDILTIQVSMFINNEDESMIFQALSKLEKKRFQIVFNQKITQLIDPKYFYMDLDKKTSHDVIEYLCDQLYEGGVVNKFFKKGVLKREDMSPTSFAYSFATPHSFGDYVNTPTLSVAILKNPIDWGSFKVKLVILLAINEEDHDILKMFFDWLSQAIGEAGHFSDLLESKNYNEFICKITKEKTHEKTYN
ncbi:BglG family transcription antiterminator [Candidatus Stoquefichus massiliensis]|uniref:BglG family transcription antiterminator n=1 Tax=Candidatus Stoquefichus massiliensis TaxID=1470350 RepID=UPI000483F951|nr:BglG family transcription antiterminator [Candidatus Stoquefichus massiliensis]